MVIQKVHGIHATGMSLHERFSILATAAPDRVAMRQRRRSLVNQNLNYSNRLLEQVARQLQQQQAKRQALRQRLGIPQPGLRRFGSEGSLAGLKRSNSFGNLSQQSVKNRVAWRQSNFNLSRSSSFNNFNNFAWYGRALREFRKRGGVQRALRGRFRAGRQGVSRGPQQRLGFQQRRGFPQRGRRTGQRRAQQTQQQAQQQTQQPQQQRPQVARRGATRGRGRGGITRSQSQSRLLSKEELDAQLDRYMSCTKAALDQQLDNYMKSAMEIE